MSKDDGGWKFVAHIILLGAFVVFLASVLGGCTATLGKTATAAPAPVAEDVARADPFYRDSFDGLVSCNSEDIECRDGMTPDEVVSVLKRQPDKIQLYEHAKAGISGVVLSYVDGFGYLTAFQFRKRGPVSSAETPHLFLMATTMPTALERPRR